MRFHSTPESADNLEPTWLAIFETALAIIALLALAYWQGSARFFLPSLLLAPVVLMSTPRSGVISYALYEGSLRRSENKRRAFIKRFLKKIKAMKIDTQKQEQILNILNKMMIKNTSSLEKKSLVIKLFKSRYLRILIVPVVIISGLSVGIIILFLG